MLNIELINQFTNDTTGAKKKEKKDSYTRWIYNQYTQYYLDHKFILERGSRQSLENNNDII